MYTQFKTALILPLILTAYLGTFAAAAQQNGEAKTALEPLPSSTRTSPKSSASTSESVSNAQNSSKSRALSTLLLRLLGP